MTKVGYHFQDSPETRFDAKTIIKELEEKSEESREKVNEMEHGATNIVEYEMEEGTVYVEVEENQEDIENYTFTGDEEALDQIPAYLLEENPDASKVPLPENI